MKLSQRAGLRPSTVTENNWERPSKAPNKVLPKEKNANLTPVLSALNMWV